MTSSTDSFDKLIFMFRTITITAVVPPVPGETDTADNTLQSETVAVKARETPPLPLTELIIGIVVIVAVIAVVVFALRLRRKKPPIE